MNNELYSSLLESILLEIKPSKSDYERVREVCRKFTTAIEKKLAEKGVKDAEPRVEGSIAKDTWLKDDKDIDIFILFPKTYDREFVKKVGYEVAKEAALEVAGMYSEEYAEHPYVSTNYEGFKVEIVPGYKISFGEKVLTAVDRTPLHTAYVNSKLSPVQKDQVRLLKKFLKGIGVYGAEIKVRGFSGYLTELLIAYYGDFLSVLKASQTWKPFKTVIDVESKLSSEEKVKAIKKYKTPLIVIDPVDPNRNVASALSIDSFAEFRYAAYMFLIKPSRKFFFGDGINVSVSELANLIESRESSIIGVETDCPQVPEDILWGELYKSLKRIKNLLLSFDFNVIGHNVWCNGERVVFVLELERDTITSVKKHEGPPVGSANEIDFLLKHLNNPRDFSLPFSENGKWYVYMRRKYTRAHDLLRDRLLNCGLSKDVREAISKNLHILNKTELLERAKKNRDFRIFLFKWLTKYRPWVYDSRGECK
ncbi:MAG: CCA tRNA nucleotidyltransferase [Thermoprotei archaeon]|nr:MAG: CCA tRNA nucleotidyltransferase [Thermoprotei archaeon]